MRGRQLLPLILPALLLGQSACSEDNSRTIEVRVGLNICSALGSSSCFTAGIPDVLVRLTHQKKKIASGRTGQQGVITFKIGMTGQLQIVAEHGPFNHEIVKSLLVSEIDKETSVELVDSDIFYPGANQETPAVRAHS